MPQYASHSYNKVVVVEEGRLERTLVGLAANLHALELPCCKARKVQMTATDLRPRAESLQRISQRLVFGRRARSKFELELDLAGGTGSPQTAHVAPALGPVMVRLGFAAGSRPPRSASRAFSRRIGSSGMA